MAIFIFVVFRLPVLIINCPPVVATYFIKFLVSATAGRLVGTDVNVLVNKPRPCVAAANKLSAGRNFSISVLTFGRPEVCGIHAPLLLCAEYQTPTSVASK